MNSHSTQTDTPTISARAEAARLQADTDTLRDYSPAIYNDLREYSAELRNDREEQDIARIIERAGGTR
jgi:hypothetical protein